MVKSNKGRSVHDSVQGVDSPRVDDVGLDSGGFPSEGYNPKEVTGTSEVRGSDNYQQDSGYDDQDKVREWKTQGNFGPEDEVFDVFNAVMDAPEEKLEQDQKVMTDGGVPNGSPFYREEDAESLYGPDERPMTD
jgi:hypothetical protein